MIIRLPAKKEVIYRYMPVHRLIDMLSTNHLFMLKTTMWDDPFEGFLFERYIRRYPCSPHRKLREFLYCLCLSQDTETDQLWKSYTPEKNGVCIRVAVDKLKIALDDRFVLASVEYKNTTAMRKVLEEHLRNDSQTEEKLRDLFFYKLLGFHTDKEVRLLTIDPANEGSIKNVKIDTCEIIDDIMWDPRMPECLCEIYEESIEKINRSRDCNLPKPHKSTLYDPKKHLRLEPDGG